MVVRTGKSNRLIMCLLLAPIFYLLIIQIATFSPLHGENNSCFQETPNIALGQQIMINISETSHLMISVYTDKAAYMPSDNVTIFGYVTSSTGAPIQDATVAIEVKDPNNNTIFLDIDYTNSQGYYSDQFRLHKDSLPGIYNVYATASATGYTPAANMCSFSVEEAGFHDISIIDLACSPKQPVVNQTLTITVTIANLGNYTETFELSVNYTRLLDPAIGTQTITLAPRETATINFTWIPNATGRYEIKAYTSFIPADINPEDNTKVVYIYVSAAHASASSLFANQNEREEINIRGRRTVITTSSTILDKCMIVHGMSQLFLHQ